VSVPTSQESVILKMNDAEGRAGIAGSYRRVSGLDTDD
jgi:hypothetical protein